MDLKQLIELKEILEQEKIKEDKYVIVIGDNGYDFKSSFNNFNDERLLNDYKKIENTKEFIKQIEFILEKIVRESVNNNISFDKISMKTEVGCLCTPIFKERLFMRMKYFNSFINGDWYETISDVEKYDNLKACDNICNKYVPIVFRWKIGNYDNNISKLDEIKFRNNSDYYELFDSNIPQKIVGIVDFDKFIYIVKSVLGYDISMISSDNENIEIFNFNHYLEQIINCSYLEKSTGVILSANFEKNKVYSIKK